mgnify:CR=1 FL=1
MDSKISQANAVAKIRNQECFGALDSDGIWRISIKEYTPLVCMALHDGSGFPLELEPHCLLAPAERIFEETGEQARSVESRIALERDPSPRLRHPSRTGTPAAPGDRGDRRPGVLDAADLVPASDTVPALRRRPSRSLIWTNACWC